MLFLANQRQNRLTISTGANHVLYDSSLPDWSTTELCTEAVRRIAQVYPHRTLQDFVSEHVMRDPALRALIAGAAQAQAAFNTVAETPIEELDEGSDKMVELQKAISTAQDAYRRYSSYGQTLPSSFLSTAGQAIFVSPDFDGRVPIRGTGTRMRVEVTAAGIALLSLESDRGRTIVTFDQAMRPTIAPEFRPYLVGDRVDVAGVVRRRIRRGETDAAPPRAPPTDASEVAPVAPVRFPLAAGCTKDTDCKGDRVCERGRCVSPR